jgi:hypothetical protein
MNKLNVPFSPIFANPPLAPKRPATLHRQANGFDISLRLRHNRDLDPLQPRPPATAIL